MPDNPSRYHTWAGESLAKYFYRKEFGLTYQEYIREPVDEINVNTLIANIISQQEQKEIEKTKRKSKKWHK